jgi:uncharacterized protein YndB with AHSA1/START domain
MNGKLEQAGDLWRLRFTRRLRHSPEKVWSAITEPEHLAAWFPDRIVVDEWAVGAPLRFEHEGGDPFEGEVLAVDPPSVLEFGWGTDTIRLEIAPDGDGCTLTLLDTFDELGKAARDAAGWHTCLDALERHLAGDPSARAAHETWSEVHPGYVEDLGPEAATIGPPKELTGD